MSWADVTKRTLPTLLWAALAIGWTALAYHLGGQAHGAAVQAAWDAERTADARAIANAVERQLDTERVLGESLATQDLKHQEELNHVQKEHDRFVADLRAGAIRVSIPVRAPACRATSDAGATAASPVAQARAELDPTAAAALAAVARDGDTAIVDLNACIDRYEQVRRAAHALSDAQTL